MRLKRKQESHTIRKVVLLILGIVGAAATAKWFLSRSELNNSSGRV